MTEHRELRVMRKGSEFVILYDQADAEIVESRTWHIKACTSTPGLFYAYASFRKPGGKHSTVYMHALITGLRGPDHINHNGLDNRRCNLRPATAQQNGANSRPMRGTSSVYKGVSWHKRDSRWGAQITSEGRTRYLGYFTDEIEAAKAYDRAARDVFGEFACLNFPVVTR